MTNSCCTSVTVVTCAGSEVVQRFHTLSFLEIGTTLKMANVTEAPSPPPTTTACSYVGSNATEPGATNISSTQQLEASSFSTMTLPNTTLKSAWTATTGSTKHTVSSVTMSPGNEISNGTEVGASVRLCVAEHIIPEDFIQELWLVSDDFKTKVGRRLWQLLCNDPLALHPTSPCHVELAKSEVKPYCMLLILGDTADNTSVQQHAADLRGRLGIKSYRKEETRNHQDFSRKTLIALVTSGLSVAILGLAAYFLMKRRSWSPMRERLGEDPYYMENSSQGNTLISAGAHEQPEPQEKPNLKGGAQENGTGQTASKNGRSAKPHVLADTEM
uniref:CD34 molecule n=1 Tax=Crocodylus porosus TaxID=8502 RepID=A0A7M4DUW1_CROPO